MKIFQKTISVLLGIAFTLSSTGIVVFYNYCCCTGDQMVSFYISQESCEGSSRDQVEEDCCANEVTISNHKPSECLAGLNECGCTKPVARFFKLVNEMSNEVDGYVNFQHGKKVVKLFDSSFKLNYTAAIQEETQIKDGPPPDIVSSHDFLIRLHQLKIPESA